MEQAIATYLTEHWWMSFWIVFWLCLWAHKTVRFIVNRILRTIKVLLRGWPPAHLDADGDWKPEPKEA